MVARLRSSGLVAVIDPTVVAPRKIASEDFSRAMLELTDIQRRVIIMRFGGELSIAETAKAMAHSEDSVKLLQFNALRALRRILEAQMGGGVAGRIKQPLRECIEFVHELHRIRS